jgi:hypothetical protein
MNCLTRFRISNVGMLKKAASGVLALLPCSRTESTLRASKWRRPYWTDFFEHSLSLMLVICPGVFVGFWHEIFNRSNVNFGDVEFGIKSAQKAC